MTQSTLFMHGAAMSINFGLANDDEGDVALLFVLTSVHANGADLEHLPVQSKLKIAL